ncbi:MAG: right-handed parallel beta-helix repeat-containing protein, partial [Bacteroidales bacterium]|nr:right-handed parallel beta-helix repeat-containing protein [Bacteroidales bacterium]
TPNAPADDTQKRLEVNDLYYYWLGMNYLIVCGDSDNVDVDITLDTNFGEVKHTISSVPVKENFRTNLLGNFLTTDATFTVVVDEDFEVPDIVIGENWTQTGNYQYMVNSGAPQGTLAEILAHADKAATEAATKADGPVVTIDLNGDVYWETEGGIGSSPLLLAESLISKVIINGNNKTFTATGAGVGSIRLANGGLLEFNNVNIVDESVSYAENAWEFTYLEFAGNLAFNECTFNSGVQFETEGEEAVLSATFNSCRFITDEDQVYAAWVSDGIASFNGCTFEGTRGLKMHEDYGSVIASVTVDGCTFGPLSEKPGIAIGSIREPGTSYTSGGTYTKPADAAVTSVTIKNSTFNKCQAGDQGNYIYETDTDVNTFDFTLEGNTVIAGGDEVIEQEDESLVVSTAAALRAALAANYATVPTIKLADGVYEGLFYVNGKSLNIEALNEGMAKIDGKLAIAASGKTVNVKGIVFENAYSGDVKAGHQYLDKTGTYCIGLYCASVNVENCTFNLSKDGGINFYSFNAPERCTVKNSTFNANGFRPIISKANLTVEGCTFNDQNKYALQVWGNQNTGSETVVFQNNTIVDPGKTSGVASGLLSYVSISKSYAISNVAFTIEGNTPGYHFIYDDHANVKITECSLNGNSIVSRQCVAIDGVTDAKEVVIDYVPTTEYVSSAA